jgi:membrane-associated phospholipid phosphatase
MNFNPDAGTIKNWFLGCGLVLGTAALMVFYFDQFAMNWLENHGVDDYYRPIRTLTDVGESDLYFLLAVAGLAWGFAGRRWGLGLTHKSAQVMISRSQFLLSSLLLSGVVLHIGKFSFGRQRPHMTDDFQAQVFEPFNTHWHFQSFPSGHSQTVFTVATFVFLLWPKSRYWVYSVAVLVALTRLGIEAHFPSDILVGGFVGISVTTFVWKKWFEQKLKAPGAYPRAL